MHAFVARQITPAQVKLVVLDPDFGYNKYPLDTTAMSKRQLQRTLQNLMDHRVVNNSNFVVVTFCSLAMVPGFISAFTELGAEEADINHHIWVQVSLFFE